MLRHDSPDPQGMVINISALFSHGYKVNSCTGCDALEMFISIMSAPGSTITDAPAHIVFPLVPCTASRPFVLAL